MALLFEGGSSVSVNLDQQYTSSNYSTCTSQHSELSYKQLPSKDNHYNAADTGDGPILSTLIRSDGMTISQQDTSELGSVMTFDNDMVKQYDDREGHSNCIEVKPVVSKHRVCCTKNSEDLSDLIYCRKLHGVHFKSPVGKVSKEISRCLHEYKRNLIHNVTRVLGVKVTLDLFHKTAKIQSSGGELTSDNERRKSPGGVFLRLVKEIATEKQSEAIFKDEKERHSRRKKCARQKRLKERTQNSMDITKEDIKEELEDKNKQVMSSQGHVVTSVPQELNLYDHNTMEEEMEVEHHDQVDVIDKVNEELAAEFEQIDEIKLDFGIDFT